MTIVKCSVLARVAMCFEACSALTRRFFVLSPSFIIYLASFPPTKSLSSSPHGTSMIKYWMSTANRMASMTKPRSRTLAKRSSARDQLFLGWGLWELEIRGGLVAGRAVLRLHWPHSSPPSVLRRPAHTRRRHVLLAVELCHVYEVPEPLYSWKRHRSFTHKISLSRKCWWQAPDYFTLIMKI